MSVTFDVYPEILVRGHPLTLYMRNPTNSTQDITIEFVGDTTVLMSVTRKGIAPMQASMVVLDWEQLAGLPLDKPIAVRARIPTPPAGVYLMGTTTAPATTGGSYTIMITSSTVKIKFIDETGAPIPYAHLMLFDHQSRKVYKYVGNEAGEFALPARIADTHGEWTVEIVKLDYDRRRVAYALIPRFDFTDKVVLVEWTDRVKIDLETGEIPAPDVIFKAISDLMPEPLRSVAKAIGDWLGWTVERTANLILGWFAFYVSKQSGGKVTSMRYDPLTRRIKMSVAYDPFGSSPIGIVGAIIAILALLLGIFIAIHIMIGTVAPYIDAAIEEMRATVRETLDTIKETVSEAIDKGVVVKEAGVEAVRVVTEAMRHAAESTPATLVERVALPAAVGVGGLGAGVAIGWAAKR